MFPFDVPLCYPLPPPSFTRAHLQRFVAAAKETDLRNLLNFITGQMNFSGRHEGGGGEGGTGGGGRGSGGHGGEGEPRHGNGNMLWVMQHLDKGRMPEAHTCFRELFLSEEEEYSVFESKLATAILVGGFGLE